MMRFKGSDCNIEVDYYSKDLVIEMGNPTEVGNTEEIIEFYGTSELLGDMDIDDVIKNINISDILNHYSIKDLLVGMEDDMMDHLIKNMGESWIVDNLSESTITQIQREYKIDNLLDDEI